MNSRSKNDNKYSDIDEAFNNFIDLANSDVSCEIIQNKLLQLTVSKLNCLDGMANKNIEFWKNISGGEFKVMENQILKKYLCDVLFEKLVIGNND